MTATSSRASRPAVPGLLVQDGQPGRDTGLALFCFWPGAGTRRPPTTPRDAQTRRQDGRPSAATWPRPASPRPAHLRAASTRAVRHETKRVLVPFGPRLRQGAADREQACRTAASCSLSRTRSMNADGRPGGRAPPAGTRSICRLDLTGLLEHHADAEGLGATPRSRRRRAARERPLSSVGFQSSFGNRTSSFPLMARRAASRSTPVSSSRIPPGSPASGRASVPRAASGSARPCPRAGWAAGATGTPCPTRSAAPP